MQVVWEFTLIAIALDCVLCHYTTNHVNSSRSFPNAHTIHHSIQGTTALSAGNVTDDGNSDDENINNVNNNNNNNGNLDGAADDVTKIIERYGSCPESSDQKCLWYKMKIRNTNSARAKNCMQQHLDKVMQEDPKFHRYLKKRFYLLKKMKLHNEELHQKLEQLLKAKSHTDIKMLLQTKENAHHSSQIEREMLRLIDKRKMERRQRFRKKCHSATVHFVQDMEVMLRKLYKKSKVYEQSMHDWVQMNYTQKQKLYKILLRAQERDMQRLLQLRSLKLWYSKKLHLLDLQSRRRLQQIMAYLSGKEHRFQGKLWKRLDNLQKSSEEWTKHEASYKMALLMMSRQQAYMLKHSIRSEKKLEFLMDLMTRKIIPQQEMLAEASAISLDNLATISKAGCGACSRIKLKKQKTRKTVSVKAIREKFIKAINQSCCKQHQPCKEIKLGRLLKKRQRRRVIRTRRKRHCRKRHAQDVKYLTRPIFSEDESEHEKGQVKRIVKRTVKRRKRIVNSPERIASSAIPL